MNLIYEPVTAANLLDYIRVGIQSYQEHYLHLWENGDPSSFVNAYLTETSVLPALKDPKQGFYLIKEKDTPLGILNVTFDAPRANFLSKDNLLLNKIYLLKSQSGRGVGAKTLDFVEQLAIKHDKNLVWLLAMQKGKPKDFYQKHRYKIIEAAEIQLSGVLHSEKAMWLMAKQL
ncbi:GNAT family N-acetyltransferase [uncultured Croceitalea sp.]|uniref:GNAT family N-acetyltransferase n=1 Tax=uncultured Croceitalea sp. TaxID=1798908 RepID=UPI00330653B6